MEEVSVKILFLNWKDPWHPNAGGAEEYTLEIGRRLATRGHTITWFSPLYPGAAGESKAHGIRFLRRGGRFSVYFRARNLVRSLGPESRPDVIVDEINTRPFFAGSFTRSPARVVNLIHALAREVWFYETPFPVNLLGRFWLEDRWLRRISQHPTITVSESTRADLERIGFRDVTVIFNGPPAYPEELGLPAKSLPPQVLFVGRLSHYKRPEDAIMAFLKVCSGSPSRLTVIGDGPLLGRLKRRYPGVVFRGRIGNQEKWQTLRQAAIILVPGTREGWGRVVLEAQSVETVPIVYDVPGLRDAADYGAAGVIVSPPNWREMSDALARLLGNPSELARLAAAGAEWSRRFDWEASTDLFERVLQRTVPTETNKVASSIDVMPHVT
jgi:glycosyltransferase involved in cell wall biosynthesis